MAIVRNAAEEFQEEILYGAAYSYVFPQVREFINRQFPDELDAKGKVKPNILKEAVESSINVLMMGAMFIVLRYQEAFLEKLFALSKSASVFVLAGGKDFLNKIKNKIKGKRGVAAKALYDKHSDTMQTRVQMAQHIQSQTGDIVKARDSQYNSVGIYNAPAQMHDSAIQKERLYQELGSSKVQAKMMLANYKLQTGTFSESDKVVLKALFRAANPDATYNPDSIDIGQLNKISEYMFVVGKDGKIKGLTSAMVDMLNGLGYTHKLNSGGN